MKDRIEWRVVSDEERTRLVDAVRDVLKGYRWVKAAYLYGSAATADRPARDIDIALVASPVPADPKAESSIAEEIYERLSPCLELDVRIINSADPVFLYNVIGKGILIYESDRDFRTSFEAASISRWLDFKPVWDRTRRQVLAGWADG